MGISNLAIPYVFSTIALQYASAGFLGLTTALIPLFTALLGKRLVGLNVLQLDREAYLRSELLQLLKLRQPVNVKLHHGGFKASL